MYGNITETNHFQPKMFKVRKHDSLDIVMFLSP